jgi:hypothetical protein
MPARNQFYNPAFFWNRRLPSPALILLGLVAPALIAGAITLVGGLLLRNASWPPILGLCVGLVVAYRGFAGVWVPVPPVDAPERIIVFAVGLGVVACFANLRIVPTPIRIVLAIVAPAAVLWFIFKPLPTSAITLEQKRAAIVVATGIATVLWASTEALAIKNTGAAAPLLLWFFAAVLRRSIVFTRGPVYVVVAILTGLVTYDYVVSDNSITLLETGLLAIAPLLGWIVEIPALRRWHVCKREALRLILVSIPIGLAVMPAVIQFRKEFAGNMDM